ncbi:MAG TPA: hypothetical protein DD412_06885 [Holosporales bacterium]|nr:hypothetical protein [Holosporales bacterium]
MRLTLKILFRLFTTGVVFLLIAVFSLFFFAKEHINTTYNIHWDSVQIGWHHLTFKGLRFTSDPENTPSLQKVSLYFDYGKIYDKEIKKIVIDRLIIPLNIDEDNNLLLPHLSFLDKSDHADTNADIFTLPDLGFSILETEIKHLTLKGEHTTYGPYSLDLEPDSFLLQPEQSLSSKGPWAASSSKGNLKGTYVIEMISGLPFKNALKAHLTITEGSLAPIKTMTASEVSGNIHIENQELTYSLMLKDILYGSDFAPLNLKVDGKTDLQNKIDFKFALSLPFHNFTLNGEGEHSFTGNGHTTVTSNSLVFPKNSQSFEKLWKKAPPFLKTFSGKLNTKGTLKWTKDGLEPSLIFTLLEGNVAGAGYNIEGLETKLHLKGLSPLLTAPQQVMHIQSIKGPLALKKGKIIYGATAAKGLKAESLSFDFAGGTIKATPISLWPLKFPIAFDLTFKNVSLYELTKLAEIDGLSAKGILKGTLPVKIHSDFSITIDTGFAHATNSGYIRYRPLTKILPTDHDSTSLISQALENFEFSDFKMDIKKIPHKDTELLLDVTGHNPKVLEGHPFHFRINVKGPLEEIIQKSLDVMMSDGKLDKNILKNSHE